MRPIRRGQTLIRKARAAFAKAIGTGEWNSSVDMIKTYQGSCHCGRVRFEVDADIDHVRACDCSVCRKRGALIHRVAKDQLRLITPWEELKVYQWGSYTARDFFCPDCGILPFRRPSDPTPEELQGGVKPFGGWAVNVRCLEGIDFAVIPIRKIYGSPI